MPTTSACDWCQDEIGPEQAWVDNDYGVMHATCAEEEATHWASPVAEYSERPGERGET